MEADIRALKEKVEAGASYVVTQMFFDNNAYFDFVERCMSHGINVPIIPGLKPIVNRRQLELLPRVFGVKLPDALVRRLEVCRDDADAKQIGVDWCTEQSVGLYESGVKSIHYYSHNAIHSVKSVVENLSR